MVERKTTPANERKPMYQKVKGDSTFSSEAEEVMYKGLEAANSLMIGVISEVNRLTQYEASHKIYAAALLAAPALKLISGCIAKKPEKLDTDEDTAPLFQKETMLVAALIAARVVHPKIGAQYHSDFTGRNVLAAIEAAAKIAEKDLRPMLDESMLECYEQGSREAGQNDLSYWAYLDNVGPDFSDFGEQLVNYTKNTRH